MQTMQHTASVKDLRIAASSWSMLPQQAASLCPSHCSSPTRRHSQSTFAIRRDLTSHGHSPSLQTLIPDIASQAFQFIALCFTSLHRKQNHFTCPVPDTWPRPTSSHTLRSTLAADSTAGWSVVDPPKASFTRSFSWPLYTLK